MLTFYLKPRYNSTWDCDPATPGGPNHRSHFLKYFNLSLQPACLCLLTCNKADLTRPQRRFVISTFLSVPGKPLCWECGEFSANIHSLPVSSGRLKNAGIFISGGHVKTGLKGFFWRYNFLLIITFVLETVIWKWGWGGSQAYYTICWARSLLLNMRTRRCCGEKLYLPSSLLFFSASFIFSPAGFSFLESILEQHPKSRQQEGM